MTPERCPSCDAALAAGAQWCTLCYADLRPAQPAQPASAPAADPLTDPLVDPLQELVAAAVPAQPSSPVAPSAPQVPQVPLVPQQVLGGPKHALIEETPVMTAADAAVTGQPGWPCQTCGDIVALKLTECPQCGSSFMADAKANIGLKLPVVGEVTQMTTGGRFALMAGGAVMVTALFVLLLIGLGHIF